MFCWCNNWSHGMVARLSLSHDRHSTFAPTKPASRAERIAAQVEGKGEQQQTQFGRLLEEREISSIAAHSPQAKGRVERLFGTLQDRLVLELRLADVRTLEEANAFLQTYLPRFHAQFAVAAQQEGLAYQPLPEGLCLPEVFCFKYERVVGPDHVVRFGTQRLQIQPDTHRRSSAKAKVEVQERLDGSVAVFYQGRCLQMTEAPAEAPVLRTHHKARRPAAHGQVKQEANALPPEQEQQPTSTVRNPRSPWRKGPMISPRTFSLDT
jgi:hypothetical protein